MKDNISGTLNVYFPFELKDNSSMRHITHLYNKQRDLQIKCARRSQHPRTDLMDKKMMRDDIEKVIAVGQKLMGGVHVQGCAPYATENIRKAYHKEREDQYFAMEASVLISYFLMVCPGVNTATNAMEGALFYFNNLANHVGTYVLAMKFQNLMVDDILRLKHSFYKRALVHIMEQPLSDSDSCYDNRGLGTFQDYICLKARTQSWRRRNEIDCRARYTFLEIEGPKLKLDEYLGLLTSSEKYSYVRKDKRQLENYSKYESYSLYYNLRSALLVNHRDFEKTLKRQRDFFKPLQFGDEQIGVEIMEKDKWIAGLDKGKFPEFLKSVEIHLLTNNALRHETVRHEISYYNPYILLKRSYKLWKILYEMDMSHCYVNGDMFASFEVNKNLAELKDESKNLNNHILNYSMVLLSIVMTFFTVYTCLN